MMFGMGGLLVVGSVEAYLKFRPHPDTSSYRLVFDRPKGWVEEPNHPGSIFMYRDSTRHFVLRGGMLSLISDINPTPDIDTDKFAQQYLDLTAENLKGWNGKMLGTVAGHNPGTTFRLVRREREGRCMLAAVCVRGNTTVSVSLAANGTNPNDIDSRLDWFRDYVGSISLEREAHQFDPLSK